MHSSQAQQQMQRRRCGFAATVKLRASCTDPPPTATRTAFRGVCLPRLLAWACTEAVRTKQRELVLGQSLADCMRELGVTSNSGGRRGERTRLWWPDTRHESDLLVGLYFHGFSYGPCSGGLTAILLDLFDMD